MACKLLYANSSPVEVARTLSSGGAAGLVFFDSGRADSSADGPALWSIIACDPDAVCTEPDEANEWLAAHARRSTHAPRGGPDLPFHGGIAGMLGFEFAWMLDDIHAKPRPRQTPDIWVANYPSALVFSHTDATWWLVGDAQSGAAHRLRAAVFARPDAEIKSKPTCESSAGDANFRLSISPDEYAARAQKAIDAIYAGEVFEVNYTERFGADWAGEGFELYEKLRALSTGAYCAYLDAGDFQLASLSPEQFLAVDAGRITTRPIKGTRPRGQTPAEDARLAEELVTSPKDRAENIMIVDLMRNDLTRICRPGTVRASEICALYSFSGVHHLISTVTGALDDQISPTEALLACFPPGSITGAPKLRAIELIAELEEDARGPYTGALFYASNDARRLDSSVLIRTALIQDGRVSYGAGGAVVADSDPQAEYQEACVKAQALATFFGAQFS